MELPKYIHGYEKSLPKTLASRVSFLRNARRIHILDLARDAKVEVKLLEEIEAGIETWLSTSVRQRIARVLKVDPVILEEVEIKNVSKESMHKDLPTELLERIKDEILFGEREVNCPLCQNPLRTWIQEGLDLNEQPVKSAKAHCTVCVFQLKS